MKSFGMISLLLVCGVIGFAGNAQSLSGIDRQAEARMQLDDYLSTYLSFAHPGDFDGMMALSARVSIDRVEGDRVYGYANREEFEALVAQGADFRLESYPRSLVEPEMSDYRDCSLRDEITKYPTYDGYMELLKKFEQQYPQNCKTEEIGKSGKGRTIMALRVAKDVSMASSGVKVFLSCGIHGDELNGTMIVYNYVAGLLKRSETEPLARTILNGVDLWFAPLCNPDGTYRGGNNSVSGAVRSNGSGVDLNRDYPSPKGGLVCTKGAAGAGDLQYADLESRLQQETRVLTTWEKEKGFKYGLDYHDGMSAIVCHWSHTKSRPKDWAWMEKVGNQGYAKLVGVKFGQAAVDWYPATGTRMDWQPGFNACQGFTVEVGRKGSQSASTLKGHFAKHFKALDKFLENVTQGY